MLKRTPQLDQIEPISPSPSNCADALDTLYGPDPPNTQEALETIRYLSEEVANKKQAINKLRSQLSISASWINRFSYDDKMIQFYTGFRSCRLFIGFFNCIASIAKNMSSPYHKPADADCGSRRGHPRVMLLQDELFMTLCQIRLGLLETDLGVRFDIAMSTVSRILLTWINLLYITLGRIPIWLDKDTIKGLMPTCFKNTYPDVRIIIDCAEVKTQYASSLKLNSQLY